MMTRIVLGLTLSLLTAGGAAAQQALGVPVAGTGEHVARATLMDTNGNAIGTAELIQTPTDVVLVRLDVRGLEPGTHAFHIHETGLCTPPDFTSAGGHYAPHGRSHGVLHPDGEHGGDMLNIQVPESGHVQTERVARYVTLRPGAAGYLLDADGSALVIHSGADDYESQPSGDAGSRVACGVIR
jgi:superoxide dismutase, Cu-Zn family